MTNDVEMISVGNPDYIVIKKGVVHQIPDRDSYFEASSPLPIFHPYTIDTDITGLIDYLVSMNSITLVDRYRLSVIKSLFLNTKHLDGEVWECGVYRGGTARFFAQLINKYISGNAPRLRLFDTFAGMPNTDAVRDIHRAGDFADTSLEAVMDTVGPYMFVDYHPGFVPDTFSGLEASKLKFVHIDLDIYNAIKSSCEFTYPRMAKGGIMLFDDYGFASCPGARMAVDEFFEHKGEVPVVLPTGQAFVICRA